MLNLVGDGHSYGKEIGGDLWEGKRTLILVDLFAKSAALRGRAPATASWPNRAPQRLPREIEWINDLIDRNGSIDVARAAARQFAAAAREFEVAYASAPAGADKQFLRELVEYVVDRDV